MAREYTLRQQAHGARRDAGTGCVYVPHETRAGGDYIPMHYREGDTFASEHGLLLVARGDRAFAICQSIARPKRWYLYNFAANSLRELQDNERCAHCGGFLCTCNSQPNNPKKEMKPIALKELDLYENEQPIDAVEGVLLALYEPEYKQKSGEPLKYPKQNAVLKDDAGTEHRMTFADAKVFQNVNEMKGKRLLIKSHYGSKGQTGLKMKVEGEGKYRKIWVTATASIEIVGRNGSGHAPPAQPPAQSTEHRESAFARNDSTVEDRVSAYLDIMEEVARQVQARGIPIEASTIKDISTHISMTYRGQYGSYAPPVFGKGGTQHEPASEPELPATQPAAENKPRSSWRDFVHPKSKRTLGAMLDADRGKFLELIKWAYTAKEQKEKDTRLLRAETLSAASELGFTPAELFDELFVSEVSYAHKADGFEKVIGTKLQNASDDQYIEALRKLAEIKEEAEALASEPPTDDDEIPS